MGAAGGTARGGAPAAGAVPLVLLQMCQVGARRSVRCSDFLAGEEVLP